VAWAATDPVYLALNQALSADGFAQGGDASAALVQDSGSVGGILVTPYTSTQVPSLTANAFYTIDLPPDSRVTPAGPKKSDLQQATDTDAGAVVMRDGTPLFTLRAVHNGEERIPLRLDQTEKAANCQFCRDICNLTPPFGTPPPFEVCGTLAGAVAVACLGSGAATLLTLECAALAFVTCELVSTLCTSSPGQPGPPSACAPLCDFDCPPHYQQCSDACVVTDCPCAQTISYCRTPTGDVVCADLGTDAQHCGACNNACLPDEICVTDASSNVPHCSFSGPEPCGFTPCAPDQFCCRGSIVNNCCPVGSDCCLTGGCCPPGSHCCTVNGAVGCCLG
jgi:hypothetical protein